MTQSEDAPWWRADDEKFADATPLFDCDKRPHPRERVLPPPPPPPADEPAGSPIGEALRLAAALAAWSNQSGLTDTLRQVAAEAAEALVADQMSGESGEDSESRTADGPGRSPLGAVPPVDAEHAMVCDYCPLCRGVEVMRHVQPQVSQGLAEAMASLTAALDMAVEGFAAKNRPQ